MPNWSPNWQDVRFDHAAAQAAVDELRATAGRVRDLVDLRARGRAVDLAGWIGPARDAWDDRFDATQREGTSLVDDLLREAARIEQAQRDAVAEQRARERARDEWRRQKAAEDAAALAQRQALVDAGVPMGVLR